MELVGSSPTVENANLEKFPVASVLIPWNPKHPANRMDLIKVNNNIISQSEMLIFNLLISSVATPMPLLLFSTPTIRMLKNLSVWSSS